MTSVGTETEPVSLDDRGQSILEWTRQYSTALTVAAVLIVAAGGAYWLYNKNQQIAESNAEKVLMTAKQSIQSGNAPLAQSDLQKVYSRYESTPAGVQAAMLLAQMDFDSGKQQDGISMLEKVAGSGAASTLQPTILSLEGDGYDQMGKAAEAAKKYEAAAAATTYQLEKGFQMGKAARAYQSAGNLAKAKEIWSQLAADPKAVNMSSEARVRLGELAVQQAKK